MNKKLSLLLLLIHSLKDLEASNFSLEAKVEAFVPSSKTFRDIYGTVNPSYGLQANLVLGRSITWINTNWFQKRGKSIGFKETTDVSISSTSVGASYLFPVIKKMQFYLGAGPNFGLIWLDNHSVCSPKKVSKFAFGLSVKSGCRIDIYTHFYIDAFVDYVYQPVSFKTRQDIGGILPGLGLGYTF